MISALFLVIFFLMLFLISKEEIRFRKKKYDLYGFDSVLVGNDGREYRLVATDLIIGSGRNADIDVEARGIAPYHGYFKYRHNGFSLEALTDDDIIIKGKTKTFRVAKGQRHSLESGDVICLSNEVSLTFLKKGDVLL